MKSLSCADMGINGCGFVAKADSEKEVIDKAITHGQKAHADKMVNMDMDKMVLMMKSKIKNGVM